MFRDHTEEYLEPLVIATIYGMQYYSIDWLPTYAPAQM